MKFQKKLDKEGRIRAYTDGIAYIDIVDTFYNKSKLVICQSVIVIGNSKYCCENGDCCDGIHQWCGEIDGMQVQIRWH